MKKRAAQNDADRVINLMHLGTNITETDVRDLEMVRPQIGTRRNPKRCRV